MQRADGLSQAHRTMLRCISNLETQGAVPERSPGRLPAAKEGTWPTATLPSQTMLEALRRDVYHASVPASV